MKVLYLGTVCNTENYEKEIANDKIKPSVAPLTFETALVEGFADNNIDVDIISFPMVAAFPGSKKLFWGERKEELACGYKNKWIKTINLIGLKQFSQGIFSKKLIKKWFKENQTEDKAVVIYSIYEPVAKNVIKYAGKYNTPCFAIVPDLPRDMYSNKAVSKIKRTLTDIYTKKALKIQDKFDGYIYLTGAMSDEINKNAPYIVVEGIANTKQNIECTKIQKGKKSIMYAGALGNKYGLDNLLEAFENIDDDIELWMFGTGDFENKIKEKAKIDSRIKFYGRKSRDAILEYEKKATLLVNVRSCDEEFTKFSFPSKTIEYMISGTPMLTTKLQGIPTEYFDYLFTIDDNITETIKNKLEEILKISDDELEAFGKKAQRFITDNKNGKVQAKKIISFIELFVGKDRQQ